MLSTIFMNETVCCCRNFVVIVLQKDIETSKISNYTLCGKIPTAEYNCYFAAKLAEINVPNASRWFNVGDGRIYDGYLNQALEEGTEYTVSLVLEIFFQVMQIL